MTETEVKLKLFEDYERIHGLVFSEEHKQKMMDDLDLYSFIEKINEYICISLRNQRRFLAHTRIPLKMRNKGIQNKKEDKT